MIEISNLTFSYPNQSRLFEGFSLSIKKGELWSIIGPSGCGKSTFLYFITRLIKSDSGTISIDSEISNRPRPQTGLVLQDHGLLPWSTVQKNVDLGLTIRKFYGPDGLHAPSGSKLDKNAEKRIVDYWLQRLGIAELKDKYPSQMSRGQRQRTALARTLALSPDLLLMDEPFSALDAPTSKDLQDLIVELNRERDLTCITVTHNIEEAVFMGRKILILGKTTNRKPEIISNLSATDFRHKSFQVMCAKI
ncbi:MAG: ATP-binding cassette domain-containing protein, partial [Deltaproteobacteria bacterium]|nr:ATP-binding cassette domain-containing protein [Deltaproteobacteria bacterium]